MTYNSRLIRQPLYEVDELTMRWARDTASITSTAGLSLICQTEQPLCRLAVSGEHFAGTVGLLGVFDYDNSTDFMTSRWEMVSKSTRFVPMASDMLFVAFYWFIFLSALVFYICLSYC